MSDRLDGQVALVTGGGRGIGRLVAAELADAGARVALTGRTREQVEDAAGEIGALGIVGDVSLEEDVARFVAQGRTGKGLANQMRADGYDGEGRVSTVARQQARASANRRALIGSRNPELFHLPIQH